MEAAAGTASAESLARRVSEETLAGRLITPAKLCKQIKTALERYGWRKESVKIYPVSLPDAEAAQQGQTLAIHLTPAGTRVVMGLLSAAATAMEPPADGEKTAALRALLNDVRVRFSPGLPRKAGRSASSAEAPPAAAPFALPALGSAESPSSPKFLFAELFAGIGGFRLGLESLGGRCVMMAEQDQWCQQTVRTQPDWCVEVETPGDVTELVRSRIGFLLIFD